ncbi:hypothetical protein CYPRO_2469 [Cyclonatronum proteinivorum]|uniref:Transmembrane protein n=1 Tax=Cyclonatronum proteinivorum TaxID=1457365 RepID=A0A345UMK9_9BACT|nr:hypothetical protein CYPRO_2469 [Cyclonatronum proteinivorum]
MAFRGVPGVRARHTPPVRCAHPGTPLERGVLRVLRSPNTAVHPSAVCGLPSHSPCTFPTPRAMAFRDVPGGVPVTPRPFAALTGAPLSRGEFCAFFAVAILLFIIDLRFPFKPAVCGLPSAVSSHSVLRVPSRHREPWPFGACRGFMPVTPRPFAALTRAPLSREGFFAFFTVAILLFPLCPLSSVLRPNRTFCSTVLKPWVCCWIGLDWIDFVFFGIMHSTA